MLLILFNIKPKTLRLFDTALVFFVVVAVFCSNKATVANILSLDLSLSVNGDLIGGRIMLHSCTRTGPQYRQTTT